MSNEFWDYLELRRELHELMVTGNGDSDEADSIRDRMDAPWDRMSEGEKTAAREYSARLNAKMNDAVAAANGANVQIDRAARTA